MSETLPENPPTSAPTPGAPERFGKYELLRKLAEGGMAEIFLARLTGIQGFEKLLVIKRILPDLARNREFIGMFLDEGRLAAALHHSNIVQVFEIGSVGSAFYMAMEYVPGEDVRRIMKETLRTGLTALPMEHAISIVAGTLAGLHHAHEKLGPDGKPLHIVHRDVSPQNVILTFDGNVKLLDFGIAKAAHRLSETQHGTLKGKIRYMAPEQCQGLPLDRRADIFATSILLWEMTVGRRLYSNTSEFETMKQIIERDAPRPSSFVPSFPKELDEIVMKGLQRDPALRFQTAEDMQLALEEFARENKLSLSRVNAARFMRQLFGEQIDAWQRATTRGDQNAEELLAKKFEDSDGSFSELMRKMQAEGNQQGTSVTKPTVREPSGNVPVPAPELRVGLRATLFRQRVLVAIAAGALLAIAVLVTWALVRASPTAAQPGPPAPVAAPVAVPSPAPAPPPPSVFEPMVVTPVVTKPTTTKAPPVKRKKTPEPASDLDSPLPP